MYTQPFLIIGEFDIIELPLVNRNKEWSLVKKRKKTIFHPMRLLDYILSLLASVGPSLIVFPPS